MLSYENRNRGSPHNTVLISQNQIKGKVYTLNNSQYNTPSAEPFNKCDMLFYFSVYNTHPVHHTHFDATILAIKNPTRCHLLFYCTSYRLNVFQALLCPSSGAHDHDVDYHIGRFVLGLLCVGG
jgi:hypothetical protein